MTEQYNKRLCFWSSLLGYDSWKQVPTEFHETSNVSVKMHALNQAANLQPESNCLYADVSANDASGIYYQLRLHRIAKCSRKPPVCLGL